MVCTFWICFGFICYCYFGYPLILGVVASLFERPIKKEEILPSVSVVLSVWNEEDVIEKKIQNLLSLEYPKEKIEILIGSDGSTDGTNAIVRRFVNKGFHFIKNDDRRGKMATLNDLVHKANHEIIVFNDARQNLASDAIVKLVENFSDSNIGCVSGELVFSRGVGATAKGVNVYWNYEKFLRKCESKVHSMLGATGAIYAIRRKLFVDIPENIVLDDMFVPLRIIQKGYRAIFDESAQAYDAPADSPREEHRRKARTLFGNYQIFAAFSGMFNPFASPIAIQFFSHKFLRVMIPFLMIALIGINGILYEQTFFRGMMFTQGVFYVMAIIGALIRHKRGGLIGCISKICCIPYVFCLLNFSALVGFFRFMGVQKSVGWEKARK